MQVNNSYALSSNNLWYPNLVGDPKAVSGGQSIDSWFNVNAFAAPTPGTFGNMGRNHRIRTKAKRDQRLAP